MLPLFNGSAAALTHHKMYFNQNKPVGLIWGAEGSLTVKWILTSMHCTHWNSAPLVLTTETLSSQRSRKVAMSLHRAYAFTCVVVLHCSCAHSVLKHTYDTNWCRTSLIADLSTLFITPGFTAEWRQRFLLVIQQQVRSLELLLWPCRSLHLQHLHIYQPVFLACTGSQQVTSYLSTRTASTET